MKRVLLGCLLTLLAMASHATAQVVVDGDLTDLIAVAQGSQADPINEIIPTCKSGFDLANVYVFYDTLNDDLFLGLDPMDAPPGVGVAGSGVPGDADGDNDPSAAGNPACPEVQDDQFGVGPDETYLVRIDTDNDGNFDSAVDLRIEYRNNTLNLEMGDGSPVPGGITGEIVLGVAGAIGNPGMPNQNLATDDIEIVVHNFSLADTVPLCYRLTTFSGSLVDIPPEDVLNQAITIDISDPNVVVTNEARNVTQGGIFTSMDISAADGELVEFRLTVENTGNTPLDPTQLRNTLPAELTFDPLSVVGTANFTEAGNLITFRELNGNKLLAPGDIRTIIFQATVNSPIPDMVLNSVTGGGPGPVECTGDPAEDSDTLGILGLAIDCTKEISLDGTNFSPTVTASPGQRVFYRVTISNPTGFQMDNIILSDVLPVGLDDPQTSDPNCAFAGNALTCTYASIPALGQIIVEYNANVAATSGPLINQVVVQGDVNGNQVSDICQATLEINTPCIECVKEASLDGVNFAQQVTADSGQTVTFRVTVQNCGDTDLPSVSLTDTLPAGYNNLISLDGRCVAGGNTLTCADIGPLAVAGSTVILYTADIVATSGSLANVADVVGIPGDPGNPGDPVTDQCNANTNVRTCGLVCLKEVSLDGVNYSGSVTAMDTDTVFYRLTVTNTAVPPGGCTFDQVDLVDVIPSELTFLGLDVGPVLPDTCSHDVPSNTITCAFLNLGPGESRVIEYSATVDASGNNVTATNTAIVTGTSGTPANPGTTYQDTCEADVVIENEEPRIPTLSEWGLIIMMAAFGLLMVRNQLTQSHGLLPR